MRQVLALSIGIILARCSLMPAANLDDDITEIGSNDDDSDDQLLFTSDCEPAIRLVLPKIEIWDEATCLEWDHLEPWDVSGDVGGLSNNLLVYSISLHQVVKLEGISLKRRKRSDSIKGIGSKESKNLDAKFNYLCTELAHATAQFLLETNSLDWFQRPGGVLLMVMSMAYTRGITKMKSDSDDITAKLTSSFGHCSQELINLLLTGQAVSNVFDHTLRPSGDLICRGVQSRPAIGYLTQLEAMRYLEVGGYYKTPQFPIWVIGSTSHFTVMFGDASALKESKSDVLLERVRRAFKRMDGGAEENGFIQTSQLEDFLNSVGLGYVSNQGVQTLAALIEVNGAGIILWEDLWKRTSRLLTGATLESILDDDDDDDDDDATSTMNARASSITSNHASYSSLNDEEIARRLQAEWNGETVSPSNASAVAVTQEMPSTTVEKFGPTFQLYHYNGLQGGTFTTFRITRLSADEAIGASVPLLGSDQALHNTNGFGGGLDTVLRTKWPSCKISWILGGTPSID